MGEVDMRGSQVVGFPRGMLGRMGVVALRDAGGAAVQLALAPPWPTKGSVSK